jgi:hypothetical protein
MRWDGDFDQARERLALAPLVDLEHGSMVLAFRK